MAAGWLLYGATGYTGELIARAAVKRGLNPILAGRTPARVSRLASELGLEARSFPIENTTAVVDGLREVGLVLNCAGPFSATASQILQGCFALHAHYLDITGEIDVFERAQHHAGTARRARVVVCPGVGFDVVPTDCLAAHLKAALPDASHLALGFDGGGIPSRGTAKTMVEGLASGGRVRADGQLKSVPLAFRTREIDFGAGIKKAVTIPWGDVSTAAWTTGIENIETYIPSSPRSIQRLERLERWRRLLATRPAQWWLKRLAHRAPPGPSEGVRAATRTYVWGEVRNASGAVRTARVATANGYTLTTEAALAIVRRMLEAPPAPGYYTPSQIMGADFVAALPGSSAVAVS
ncbi:MAG TPA: saccharopine dehydrogenase NADP-binding domain-containing protein [Steroidobacteraceae bacterium]|nr:saccharopine dehydrogenase NADP-binding domain-containing protein [Steroidobacteraceae bacterium]